MSPSQIRLLQQSFARIDPVKLEVGRTFYRKLSEISPQTEILLNDRAERRWLILIGTFQQLMNSQLRSMLTLPATSTQSREAVTPEVVKLAQSFVEYGLTPEQMDAVRTALLFSLSEHLGDTLDARTENAWSEIVTLVIHSMRQIMAEDAVEQALPSEKGRTSDTGGGSAMERIFGAGAPAGLD